MITSLTPEQEALISVIRNQWIQFALNTASIDRKKAEIAITNLYTNDNRNPPKKFLWFDNPFDAYLFLGENYGQSYPPSYDPITLIDEYWNIFDIISSDLHQYIQNKIHNDFYHIFTKTIDYYFFNLAKQYLLDEELYYYYYRDNLGQSQVKFYEEFMLWHYFDAIRLENNKQWRIWHQIAKHCGLAFWWSLDKFVVITSKPSVIRIDNNYRLHKQGQLALKFEGKSMITDSKLEVYARHGDILPKKYGSINYENWQPQWLSKEKDVKLRWILAKEIGYHKLSQEFSVSEVRTWDDSVFNLFHECTLLRIKSDPDGIFFLKVISFNKKQTYFCLLPENIISKRQAEIWVKATIYSESNLSRLCNQTKT